MGELVVMEGDGGGHDTVTVRGDPVASSSGNLGDEAVAAELDDEARHALTSSVGFVAVEGGTAVEAAHEVGVAEALNGMLARHCCSKQGQVGGIEGTEAGDVAPAVVRGRHKVSSALTPSPFNGAAAAASR